MNEIEYKIYIPSAWNMNRIKTLSDYLYTRSEFYINPHHVSYLNIVKDKIFINHSLDKDLLLKYFKFFNILEQDGNIIQTHKNKYTSDVTIKFYDINMDNGTIIRSIQRPTGLMLH